MSADTTETKVRPFVHLSVGERDVQYCFNIVNQPEIRDRICQASESGISRKWLEEVIHDPANQVLIVYVNHVRVGFFLCLNKGRGVYEVHTNLICHGSEAFQAARLGIAHMFMATDCLLLSSFCPMNHPEVLSFAKINGFKSDFTRHKSWLPVDRGPVVDVEHVVLHFHEWARDRCKDYTEIGARFHDKLFAIAPHAEHPEDGSHNGMVGLAFSMGITHKQPLKAQLVFNDWARRSGDACLNFLGLFDGWTLFDMQTSIVAVNEDMQVKCLLAKP